MPTTGLVIEADGQPVSGDHRRDPVEIPAAMALYEEYSIGNFSGRR
jgi:hypothetical protein